MNNLKPVRFGPIAKEGAFVYCYLRSEGCEQYRAGSPYYIGVASRADRPICKKHNCRVPRNRALIRVLRSGLTFEEALQWETFYICRYGRKDLGTGILRNLTDGGEGALGMVVSDETRAKISAIHKGKSMSRRTKVKMAEAAKRRSMCPIYREKQRVAHQGKQLSEETRRLISEKAKGRQASEETRRKLSEAGKARSKESYRAAIAKTITTRMLKGANELGISLEDYQALSREQRRYQRDRLRGKGKFAPKPQATAA